MGEVSDLEKGNMARIMREEQAPKTHDAARVGLPGKAVRTVEDEAFRAAVLSPVCEYQSDEPIFVAGYLAGVRAGEGRMAGAVALLKHVRYLVEQSGRPELAAGIQDFLSAANPGRGR